MKDNSRVGSEFKTLQQGQVVISKKGRDKSELFIVLNVATEQYGEFAWLVDGRLRSIEKPKKKKLKHIQPTKFIDFTLKHKLETKTNLENSDVRKAIRAFLERDFLNAPPGEE